jgi:MFS family permease
MKLTPADSRHNFRAFLWHAIFLALAKNFMDVDTVIPAMLVEAGGKAMHVGLLTTIMLGGASFTQLFFAPFLSNLLYKKRPLLLGINARILSLLGLGLLMLYSGDLGAELTLWLIIVLLAMFSLGGAYAMVSYSDVLGKSIASDRRKSFFSIRQVISGIGAFASVLLVNKMLTTWAYPFNYSWMLFTGFGALFLASLGFWRIRETVPSGMSIRGARQFFSIIRQELTQNRRLKYFLGYINTQGLCLAFLPFVILYAKTTFQTGAADTGHFLLFKVIGMVSVSLLVFFIARKVKYRFLLFLNSGLAVMLPVLLLLVPGSGILDVIFLLGGIVVALYSISMNGVLLELSGNQNRALYVGIAGAGNILPALFPLVAGGIIQQFGFTLFFMLYLILLAASAFFVYKIDCKQ